MTEVAKLYVGISGDNSTVVSSLKQVQDQLKTTANSGKQAGASFGMMWTEFNSALDLARQGMGALGQVFNQTVNAFAAWGHQANDMQYQLGGTTEELTTFAGAAKLVNMDVGSMGMTLRYLQTQTGQLANDLTEGKKPAGEFADALRRMGIDIAAFTQMGFNEQIAALADGLLQLPAGAERTAAGVAVMSRGFYGMTDLIEGGSAGLRELGNTARSIGLVLNQDMANTAEGVQMSMYKMSASWDALKMHFGQMAAPKVSTDLAALDQAIFNKSLNLMDRIQLLYYGRTSRQFGLGAFIAQEFLKIPAPATAAEHATRSFAAAVASIRPPTTSMSSFFSGIASKYAQFARGSSGGGGGGSDTGAQIADRQRQWEAERVDSALQAGFEISQLHRTMNQDIDRNEKGLTADMQAEYRTRTAAAWAAALAVKDNNGQQAVALLNQEKVYQDEKTTILTDTSLTEEERAKRIAWLDENNALTVGDINEQARITKEIQDRARAQEIADMRAAGAAGGAAFAEEVGTKLGLLFDVYRNLSTEGEKGAGASAAAWTPVYDDQQARADKLLRTWGNINTAAGTPPALDRGPVSPLSSPAPGSGGGSSSWGAPAPPGGKSLGGPINVNVTGPIYATSPEAAAAVGADMGQGIRMSLRSEGIR